MVKKSFVDLKEHTDNQHEKGYDPPRMVHYEKRLLVVKKFH
ncbi:MAG: hypothetical protein V4721_16460 [Bacteroidota bacterium]